VPVNRAFVASVLNNESSARSRTVQILEDLVTMRRDQFQLCPCSLYGFPGPRNEWRDDDYSVIPFGETWRVSESC
jgi:hypothetical protein